MKKLEYIKEVYREMADPDLLRRFLKGMTQNTSESLHGKLWNKLHKTKFTGFFRFRFMTQITILEYNLGLKVNLMTHMFGKDPNIDMSEAVTERETEEKAGI